MVYIDRSAWVGHVIPFDTSHVIPRSCDPLDRDMVMRHPNHLYGESFKKDFVKLLLGVGTPCIT